MTHNNNIKAFKVISKHLKMDDERQKSLGPSSAALVSKGRKPKGKSPFAASGPRKVIMLLETLNLRMVFLRSKSLRIVERRI